ncbi:NAD(P)-binding protein [Ophiobolus disseminans]|uniref:NAD(P)-binding protein n=1 Tax=Ophiobolus disseminans TaxID=1469910 RepID=A0A6A6ZXY3_9PLEO|nr:NAD(P)-binding protein [Ophiobolus disseminans]
MSKQIKGVTNFDPAKDIPSLVGKVILVTGGTAGLGRESVIAFAAHSPAHIYFTGRNAPAAKSLIAEVQGKCSNVTLTFIKMDLSSLRSVKEAVTQGFKHDRLDILMNNAGIIAKPPILSIDKYEVQFATNHLGHAMLTNHLLPHLLKAANEPNSDVRVISNTSDGYEFHRLIKGGIDFRGLDSGSTMNKWVLGPWQRYGQSKLANILFAAELARRYPQITSVVVHPGVVRTPMLTEMRGFVRWFNDTACWLVGIVPMEPHQGAWSQLWCAAGANKEVLRNGGFYRPVGIDATEDLKGEGRNAELAIKLWDWSENVLRKFE